MTTINMHMKFEIEIPKQTWLMLRKPCLLQTDGRTDGQTRWIQYTPLQLRWAGYNKISKCHRILGNEHKYPKINRVHAFIKVNPCTKYEQNIFNIGGCGVVTKVGQMDGHDDRLKDSEWVIKFNSLSGDSRQWGPYSPYKPCNHSLYIGIIIFPNIDNPQSAGHNLLLRKNILKKKHKKVTAPIKLTCHWR